MNIAKFLPVDEPLEENKGFVRTKYSYGITPVSEDEYYKNGGDEIFEVGLIKDDKIHVKNQGTYFYKEIF